MFALRFLVESRDMVEARSSVHKPGSRGTAVLRVITHSSEPASRLIWIYAIGIGAFQGLNAILALFLAARFGVTSAHDRIFLHVHRRDLGGDAGVDLGMGGGSFRRGKAVAAGPDIAGHRTGDDAVHSSDGTTRRRSRPGWAGFFRSRLWPFCRILPLALAVALLPLGTAFTFPCVTALLSRVIPS